jgi:ubiquinone/menaquinone biosynthesis C-methylase UbiE
LWIEQIIGIAGGFFMSLRNHYRTFLFALLLSISLLLSAGTPAASALQLGSRDTADWIKTLESPERIKGQKIDEVIKWLAPKPGMVIADIGAGSGVFSLPMAKLVAPGGKIYAVDIQQGLLDYVNQQARDQKITNIHAILGGYDDPKLPKKNVDMAFISDVLHHIEHRALYLKTLAKYIKPKGQIVVIEMDPRDPNTPHKDQPELQVTHQQIDQWMSDAGFSLAKENKDMFPGTRLFLVYGRK